MKTDWHRLDPDEVLAALGSSSSGLSSSEAEARLERAESMSAVTPLVSPRRLFFRQFNDPMIWILLAAGFVTGGLTALGESMLPDTIVIFGVVLLNALLGYFQERRADSALGRLRSMMVPSCTVLRDGEATTRPATEVAQGDRVILEAGDRIPADVRFVFAQNLHVDEQSLTGESIPTKKTAEALDTDGLSPVDRQNMGFSGTYVLQGCGEAVVVAIGENTEFSSQPTSSLGPDDATSPLQRKIRHLVQRLVWFILITGAISFSVSVYLGFSATYGFLGTVALIVAAIPEMLPTLVTSILALSGAAMAARNGLVRSLPAAETLGATTVICADKTGTLTEDHMTVTRLYSAGEQFDVTGSGASSKGDFANNGDLQVTTRHGTPVQLDHHRSLTELIRCGYDCNSAHLSESEAGGSPTDLALKALGAATGFSHDTTERIAELPFNSTMRFMAVRVRRANSDWILVKGAPELVVSMCSRAMLATGNLAPIDRETILATADHFAEDALRALGFAVKPVSGQDSSLHADDLTDMTFVGLQGMIDPPRPEAIEAVARCRSAGIRTLMITGDHPRTAQAIARQLGIEADEVISGPRLEKLGEASLRNIVETVSVYARVDPDHKRAIACALQQNNHVVAMTGEGINDVPALRQADIGVALGQAGTEVAKQASDMVLMDDNFATLVAAVEEGRHAWNNLQKALLYTLPTNAAQALLIVGAILLAAQIPLFAERFVLEPVQILWINLLDSVLLTLPLMMERKEQGLLASPPRDTLAEIITPFFMQRIVLIGLAISLPGFLIYYHYGSGALVGGELIDPHLLTQAQTAAFWSILFGHIGFVISARSISRSAFQLNPLGNRWLLIGIALSIGIRLVPTLIPETASLFHTAAFPDEWWPLILLSFLPSFIAIEVDKLVRRQRPLGNRERYRHNPA